MSKILFFLIWISSIRKYLKISLLWKFYEPRIEILITASVLIQLTWNFDTIFLRFEWVWIFEDEKFIIIQGSQKGVIQFFVPILVFWDYFNNSYKEKFQHLLYIIQRWSEKLNPNQIYFNLTVEIVETYFVLRIENYFFKKNSMFVVNWT